MQQLFFLPRPPFRHFDPRQPANAYNMYVSFKRSSVPVFSGFRLSDRFARGKLVQLLVGSSCSSSLCFLASRARG